MKNVFVTGATGFIGKHLVQRLVASGVFCHCLVRKTSDVRSLPDAGLSFVYGTIDQPETYIDALEKCDTVIHLAGLTHANTRDELFRINADACGQLAQACLRASVSRVVYVSSLAAAGPPPKSKIVRDESDPDQPVSDYGRSKLAGELLFRKYANQLATTVVRPGVVYGPADQKIAQLISSVVRWHLHLVVGFRTPKLSLIHVDDLAELIIAAAGKGERLEPDAKDPVSMSRGVYFACDDSQHVTYGEFGRRIAKAAKTRVLVWPIWKITGYTIAWFAEKIAGARGQTSFLNRDKIREATVWSWACSSQKAREQLDFNPDGPLDSRLPAVVASYMQ